MLGGRNSLEKDFREFETISRFLNGILIRPRKSKSFYFPRKMTKRPSPTTEERFDFSASSPVMTMDNNGFYVIDAASLQRPSRRPHFLEDRFNSKLAQRKPRSQPDNATERAAYILQNSWRRYKLGPAIRMWRRKGLKSDKAKEMSFEELARVLQTDLMVKISTSLIVRVKKMVGSTIKMKNPARVFLGAFVIVAHPKETLGMSDSGDAETVHAAAVNLVREFEGLVRAFVINSFQSQLGVFVDAWTQFYTVFEEWKSADMNAMIDMLVAHWMELEQMWLSVKEQPGAEVEFQPKIERQQKQIYDRLVRLGERALIKLRDEQVKRRKEMGDDEPLPEEALVATMSPNSTIVAATSPETIKSKRHRKSDSVTNADRFKEEAALSGASTPAIALSPPRHTAALLTPESSSEGVGHDKTKIPIPTVLPPDMRKLMGVEHGAEKISGSHILQNHALAHELVMNPDFELTAPEPSQIEKSVRDAMRGSFFELCRASVSKKDFTPLLDIFSDIRASLLSMVSEKGKVAAEIGESLDMELLKQQAEKQSFEPEKLVSYVLSKMQQLCAPIRDESLKEIISSNGDVMDKLQKITDLLDLMKLDIANFQLQQLRPILKQQAVEYEQKKFAEALEAGHVSLEKTNVWLEGAAEALKETAASRNPESIEIPEAKIRYEDIYNDALLNLISANAPVTAENCPETLLLDVERLSEAQNELQALSIVAALLMVSKTIVDKFRRDEVGHKKLRDMLFLLLKERDTTLDHISAQIAATIQDSLDKMPGDKKTVVSSEQKKMIAAMVEKTFSFKDTVYSMLSRRICSHIKNQLTTGLFRKEALASHGLDLISTELEELSKKMTFLARHNKQVFAKYYDDAIQKVVVKSE